MEISFASPSWALIGFAVVLPFAGLLFLERRAHRLRVVLRLRRPRPSLFRDATVFALIAGLVALAAAQPLLAVGKKQQVRRDAEVFLVLDNSRSMLAASGAGEATRFERARAAAERLQAAFPDVPIGLASLTDRALLHLFPTTDRGVFLATLTRAMGVDRPPPRQIGRRATRLAAVGEMAIWNYFSDSVRRRVAVVFTDGEGQPNDPEELRATLREGVRVEFLFVHVWDEDEHIFGPKGLEAAYVADPDSSDLLARTARAKGIVFAESELNDVRRAVRDRLPPGRATATTVRGDPRPLAPYAVGAAFVPLVFLLRRRNRA